MKKWPVLLLMGLLGTSLAAQEYETDDELFGDEGISWFSDEESMYSDEGLYGDEDAFGEEGLYNDQFGYQADDFGFGFEDEGTFTSDQYGTYDADYDWATNDEWFGDWYGESDGLFDF